MVQATTPLTHKGRYFILSQVAYFLLVETINQKQEKARICPLTFSFDSSF